MMGVDNADLDLVNVLDADIQGGESDSLEFKDEMPSEDRKYLRTVVAFSNGSGGRILFGVSDDREVIGIPDDSLFSVKDAIADSIASSCAPMIVPTIYTVTVNDLNIIVVEVAPGPNTPYYIKSQGKIKGTYVRVGATTRLADEDLRKSLEIRGCGTSFDMLENPSITADRESVLRLCKRISGYKKAIAPVNLVNMKVLSETSRGYMATNAYGLLTTNPFPHAAVRCVCFSDQMGTRIEDSMDLEEDIVSQVEGAQRFVMRNLRVSSEINGLIREDRYEIPMDAVREAIVNAIIHRDYSLRSMSVFVRMYPDRVEVESPGLPLVGIAQISSGRSEIRNPAIASVFKSMGLIEKYGTGIRRIIDSCAEGMYREPEFSVDGPRFLVTLYRTSTRVDDVYVTEEMAAIMDVVRRNPSVTQPLIASETGIPISVVKKTMMELTRIGLLGRVGSSRKGQWVIKEQ